MVSNHFTGGKLCDRNVRGTADTTPQNRDETWPPDSFSPHKHTESSDTFTPAPFISLLEHCDCSSLVSLITHYS